MEFTQRLEVPPHPTKPAWIVPKDELVDFTHIDKVPFYPSCKRILELQFHRMHFLPRQVACINCAIQGYDLLIALPTSAGKSLCYQLPAIYNKSTVTLVVSPTKTLIEDQIRALHALGPHWKQLAQRSHSDHYHPLFPTTDERGYSSPRIFYICPEWLDNTHHQRILYALCGQNRIARIVVDEAHNAIRGLEKQHRPAYNSVFALREFFPQIPFTLVSASLTHAHQLTLTKALHSRGQFLSVTAPSKRKNFVYRVVHVRDGVGSNSKRGDITGRWRKNHQVSGPHGQETIKVALIAAYLSNRPEARGFVFVPTRKLTQVVAEKLRESGGAAGKAEWYHAGEQARLPDIMARFNAGQISVLVCTSAFGEGIDNKLVDFVFHFSLPPSMTRYFQETGRVGRDGQKAECILLYSFSDIRSIVNVVANDAPSTNSRKDKETKDRVFLPSQRAELQEVLEFCTDSFSCRHKRMFELFKSPYPIDSLPSQATSTSTVTTRFATLYTRAMYDIYGDVPGLVKDEGVQKGVDENCGGCDVCERRKDDTDELSNFQIITKAEIEAVENAFRNDTSLLVSELVRRVSSPGNDAMKGGRAREVVEFLAVAGVLKMSFEYVRSGKGGTFSIKLEKGSTKIDSIHRPLPIPYTALGPLTLPTRSRKKTKPKPRKEKGRQRAETEDGTIDFTGDADERDSNEEWDPNNSDPSDSEASDSDSESEEADSDTEIDDDDTAMVTTSDDEDDINLIKLDGTEEDGYGMRVTPRFSPSRKRGRSTSFELPYPPSGDGPSSRYAQDTDLESLASPSKRRRVETAGRDDSDERPKTESAVMLKKFYEAAKRARGRRGGEELFNVSEETLRKLFEMHARIVDEDGFRLALKKVKASKDDTIILLSWYEWIEVEVFANRFLIGARRE